MVALALRFWFVFNALPFFMNANTMKMREDKATAMVQFVSAVVS